VAGHWLQASGDRRKRQGASSRERGARSVRWRPAAGQLRLRARDDGCPTQMGSVRGLAEFLIWRVPRSSRMSREREEARPPRTAGLGRAGAAGAGWMAWGGRVLLPGVFMGGFGRRRSGSRPSRRHRLPGLRDDSDADSGGRGPKTWGCLPRAHPDRGTTGTPMGCFPHESRMTCSVSCGDGWNGSEWGAPKRGA